MRGTRCSLSAGVCKCRSLDFSVLPYCTTTARLDPVAVLIVQTHRGPDAAFRNIRTIRDSLTQFGLHRTRANGPCLGLTAPVVVSHVWGLAPPWPLVALPMARRECDESSGHPARSSFLQRCASGPQAGHRAWAPWHTYCVHFGVRALEVHFGVRARSSCTVDLT